MRAFEIKIKTKSAKLFYQGIFIDWADALEFAQSILAPENSRITVKPCVA